MKSSWKTTLFGLLGAIGAAVAGAIATGALDPTHLPVWFKDVAVLLAIIGPTGVGFCARDNDKSSEDVGAKPTAPPPTRLPVALFASLLAVGALCGCDTTPKKAAYQTLAATGAAVDKAMQAAAAAKVAGKVSDADWDKIATAHSKFRAAYSTACDIAGSDITKATPPELSALAAELLQTVNSILGP